MKVQLLTNYFTGENKTKARLYIVHRVKSMPTYKVLGEKPLKMTLSIQILYISKRYMYLI